MHGSAEMNGRSGPGASYSLSYWELGIASPDAVSPSLGLADSAWLLFVTVIYCLVVI